MRVILTAAILAVAAVSFAQEGRWTVYAGPSASFAFLGGEDKRTGFTFGVQYSRPDPRVTLRGKKGELVLDAYFLSTKGQEFPQHPSETANAFGVLATARYWMGDDRKWFVDAGMGLQIQDKTSVDLDTYINTTPTLGIGYLFSTGDMDIQASFRFLHISNGGTNPPNQGQNQFQIMLGARF